MIVTDTVKCRECKEEFKQITHTHLKKHNMTLEEYKQKYPEQKLANIKPTEAHKEKVSEWAKKWHSNHENPAKRQEVREKIGNKHRGKTVSGETRKKMSESHKGKSLEEETKEKLREINEKRYEENPEYQNNISKKMKKWHENNKHPLEGEKRPEHSRLMKGEINPNYDESDKFSGEKNPFYGREHSDKSKKLMSKKTKKFLEKNPEKHPNRILAEKNGLSSPQLKIYRFLKDIDFLNAILEKRIITISGLRFADVALPSIYLDIEYDSEYWHEKKEDEKRNKELGEIGWTTLRIKDSGDIEVCS